jgi:glycosyltransferase involved in cell wall biosynthesis
MTVRHVLHLLGSAERSGTAPARAGGELARGLDPGAFQFHAWFTAGDGPVREELAQLGVSTRVVRWQGGWKDVVGAGRMARAPCGTPVDVVHQHYGGRSMRLLARRLSGAPVLLHCHARIGVESEASALVAIDGRGADRVVANSRATADCVRAMSAFVVYPGVRVPSSLPDSQSGGRFTVGYAGRLVPLKGVDVLVRAFAILAGELPVARLEIAGAGQELGALRLLASDLGLSERVAFLGWSTDLATVMHGWDVAVQPSHEEAFGIAALEAMACGLPVVASAVGGLTELVVDEQTGFLVPPGDVAALAAGLGRIAANPDFRRALGRAGHGRAAAHFSAETFVEDMRQHYEALLPGGGR